MGQGGRRAARITAKEIETQTRGVDKDKGVSGVQALIAMFVKRCTDGNHESQTHAANSLMQIMQMNHSQHSKDLFNAGAIPPLVQLLSHGTPEAQCASAGALAAIAAGQEEHQTAIVQSGGVLPLVMLIKTGSAKVQELAAAALGALDKHVSQQAAIIKAGAIPPLVAMVKGASASAQASAARALANIANHSREAQDAIAKAGTVPMLLALLLQGKAQMPAAGALAKLASANPSIQAEIAEANGIAPLLALLNGRNVDGQVQAAGALCELARGNGVTQAAIAKAGGIGPLLALLGSRSGVAQSQAMSALAQLAHENRDNQDSIAKMGGIRPLVSLLESHSAVGAIGPTVQACAAECLMEVARANPANQAAVVEHGGISQLAILMKATSPPHVKAEVAGALWALSEEPQFKDTIASEGNIKPLVDLLGSNGSSRALEHAHQALASLGLQNVRNQADITSLLIELQTSGTNTAQQRAVWTMNTLISENPSSHDTIANASHPESPPDASIPAALVNLLMKGIPESRDYALWALSLSISTDNQGVVAETGGVEALVKQLEDARILIQEQAALALARLAESNDATRSAIQQAGGIKPVIHLLVVVPGSTVVRENAAHALSELALDHAARDEIVGANGIKLLVQLFAKERHETPGTKEFAATALAQLAKDHAATQAAIAEAGAIVPLVALLDGDEGEKAQQEAAGALYALADHASNRLAITAADGISWLVMLLGCAKQGTREYAEGALVRLSIEPENRREIIKSLVDMLQGTNVGDIAQEQAAAALANLARESEDNRKSIVEGNGIEPLLNLLESTSLTAKGKSVVAITELCRGSKENQGMIARVDGIPKLVSVLSSFSTNTKEMALILLWTHGASAIKEMVKGHKKNQDAVAAEGAVPYLVAMLTSNDANILANTAAAITHLARNHQQNQHAIAKTGALAPLCSLVKEGSSEDTKDRAASAIWSLATDNATNKDTIAKLGGIENLMGHLVLGTTDKSQRCVAGALTSLASKHSENRTQIAKRLVGLLGSQTTLTTRSVAVRLHLALNSFCSDSPYNQNAILKAGGIPPLISWLSHASEECQRESAAALLALAADNDGTKTQIARSNGIAPLITLVARGTAAAQEYAARSLWHLASSNENQLLITELGGIKALVGMLKLVADHHGVKGERAPELASYIMVRLMRGRREVAVIIAEAGGIVPLVKLISQGSQSPDAQGLVSVGAQHLAVTALADLAVVSKNRDEIAHANGIKPLIRLLSAPTNGTPEVAARALARLALDDETAPVQEAGSHARESATKATSKTGTNASDEAYGSAQRRAEIHLNGGIKRMIAMLGGTAGTTGAANTGDPPPSLGLSKEPLQHASRMDMLVQVTTALAEICYNNASMQDAIIEAEGVAPLLAFMRTASTLGQQHAARAIWHLAQEIDNQMTLADLGAIPELVALIKNGSPQAQQVAAAGLADLARGTVVERMVAAAKALGRESASLDPIDSDDLLIEAERMQTKSLQNAEGAEGAALPEGADALAEGAPAPSVKKRRGSASGSQIAEARALLAEAREELPARSRPNSPTQLSTRERSNSPTRQSHHVADEEPFDSTDRLHAIAAAGGIMPLVNLLNTGTLEAREHASCALWHLALDEDHQVAIARSNGISPLVNVLDDGSEAAHGHAARALARLALNNEDNQAQIAKHLVGMLGNHNAGAQRRAAHALRSLAAQGPGSPVLIVNAGAISPLVKLLSSGAPEVKEETAGVLSYLAFNSPENQLAIASGLVELVGTGSAEAQEHVSLLLLQLSDDANNRKAIAGARAIPRLVLQLKGGDSRYQMTSMKAQELATAVLSRLAPDSPENVNAIEREQGIRPLVGMLSATESPAQAHAAAVLSHMARTSRSNQNKIVAEGCIHPLVLLLGKEHASRTRAEAAGALQCLVSGQPETQKAVADDGAVKPLVALLSEEDDQARMKAAGALAALVRGSSDNQDEVAKRGGLKALVGLVVAPGTPHAVGAEAAAALSVLARGHEKNQGRVSEAGGIAPLVQMLKVEDSGAEKSKQEAAAALWALAEGHNANQQAVAKAGGIPPLVAVLGLGSVQAQEQAAGALAALALNNPANESSIATMIVSLLGSNDKSASAKAARAISSFARANASNQRSIAKAGGITLLVNLLDPEGGKAEQGAPLDAPPSEPVQMQKDLASAIWSMANNDASNQTAIAEAGGIQPLIALLDGHPVLHHDVAGALWSLSYNSDNQLAIARSNGIQPLVFLVKDGSKDAQETAAGAIAKLSEVAANREAIAAEDGIPSLVAILDRGSEEGKQQSAGALRMLAVNNASNQQAIANALVEMLKAGSGKAADHVVPLIRNLAEDSPENRTAVAKAGVVPELAQQLEAGSEIAMSTAASGLAIIATKSPEYRNNVTQELVKLLGSDDVAVRQRASEALHQCSNPDDNSNAKKTVTTGDQGRPMVNLLKDGLRDGRVEAQEYALWSLSSITDSASKEIIVQAGGIPPLISSLLGGQLSVIAQEHAATVLSGLAPLGDNAQSIKDANGIEPLVQLLSNGNAEAKQHAAAALGELAQHANAAIEMAEAGAVSAFVRWLNNPSIGPPEVAARALSQIALDNPDTQTQIAEEGAISPLVEMLELLPVAHATQSFSPNGRKSHVGINGTPGAAAGPVTGPMREALQRAASASVAAGALATLAKDHIVNQAMVTEDDGIPPLVELLRNATMTSHENATKALWYLGGTQDNQSAIARAGGIEPLVMLLSSDSEITAQYAAAALESLARGHLENQIALSKAGAIEPLIALLNSDVVETQEHAVGALVSLATNDIDSRNRVVAQLVTVLDYRNAGAQLKAAEALAVLVSRSAENRKAVTDAGAILPLVRLLGEGSRARENTPQERAAAVLADLARLGENKTVIVESGGVYSLVAMLGSGSCESAQTHASGALWQLASLGGNRKAIVEAGAIPSLVRLLAAESMDVQRFSAGTLWHLASNADNKVAMVAAGALEPLVNVLGSKNAEAREYAAAVLSILAKSQGGARAKGGTKRAIFRAGGIPPLVTLLSDSNPVTQKHAACTLWALSDGKDGVYDKQITASGALPGLIALLQHNQPETRGFAAACLSCLCQDEEAKEDILKGGGVEPLWALAQGPANWLSNQARDMLEWLGVPLDQIEHFNLPPPPNSGASRAKQAPKAIPLNISKIARKDDGNSDGGDDRGKVHRNEEGMPPEDPDRGELPSTVQPGQRRQGKLIHAQRGGEPSQRGSASAAQPSQRSGQPSQRGGQQSQRGGLASQRGGLASQRALSTQRSAGPLSTQRSARSRSSTSSRPTTVVATPYKQQKFHFFSFQVSKQDKSFLRYEAKIEEGLW